VRRTSEPQRAPRAAGGRIATLIAVRFRQCGGQLICTAAASSPLSPPMFIVVPRVEGVPSVNAHPPGR